MTKKKVLITPEGITKIKFNKKKYLSNKINYVFTGKIINSQQVLISKLKDFDGCIIGSEKIDKKVIDSCTKLKVIIRFGVGMDNIDLDYARKKDIVVKNVQSESIADAVAVHAICLILALTQNIKLHINDAIKGKWLRHINLFSKDTSVGVIGAGKIGMKVISYLITLGFNVNYFSRKKKLNLNNLGAKFYKNINNLLIKSDIITLHFPSNRNSTPLFDKKKLNIIKKKYLVNLSRGSLVDEKTLLKKLDKGEIKFYATDVFFSEPPSKTSRKLLLHPKVLSTAHVGGYNTRSLQEVSEIALKKVNDILI